MEGPVLLLPRPKRLCFCNSSKGFKWILIKKCCSRVISTIQIWLQGQLHDFFFFACKLTKKPHNFSCFIFTNLMITAVSQLLVGGGWHTVLHCCHSPSWSILTAKEAASCCSMEITCTVLSPPVVDPGVLFQLGSAGARSASLHSEHGALLPKS